MVMIKNSAGRRDSEKGGRGGAGTHDLRLISGQGQHGGAAFLQEIVLYRVVRMP